MSESIVLIGNADIKENEDYGDIIDSFDNVVRFNRFETKKYEKYIGTKTTHWVLNKDLYGRDFFNKKLKGKLDVKRYVISKDTPKKKSDLKNITYVIGENTEPQKKYFSLFPTVMGEGKLPKYKAETGIITILHFLEKYEKIYLHNFDFGKTKHYFNSLRPNGQHSWSYSKKLVEYFIKKGRIEILNKNNGSINMGKTIAMIPARLGSKRVKNKNLRLIGKKPLISHIVETAVNSKIFDEIYINSEADIFENIAKEYGVKFYKRPAYLSEDDKTNDDFAHDFLQNVECDTLVQLLSTSPFMSIDDVKSFVNTYKENNYETLISVKNVQIESIYDGVPINFNQKEITPPSQDLKPIQAYACGLMAWDKKRYVENMNKFSSAYHGGDGRTGFYELDGYATIDIDTEDDFKLAEVIHKHLSTENDVKPEYYTGDINEER